jgi:hypothetical protein
MKYCGTQEVADGLMKYGGEQERADGLMKYRVGTRSAAGRMTSLSLTLNEREHRFQMHH